MIFKTGPTTSTSLSDGFAAHASSLKDFSPFVCNLVNLFQQLS